MPIVCFTKLPAIVRFARPTNHHSNFSAGQFCATDASWLPRQADAASCRPSLHVRASAATPPDVGTGAPPPAPPRKKRLAVFVSGGGSNFRAIHGQIVDGTIDAEVAAVVTNAPTCSAAVYAASHHIPVIVYPAPKNDPAAGLTSHELVDAMCRTHAVDFIVLAGYMKLVPAALVRCFPRAMLNIHPGLLPSFGGKGFYGARVHAAVIASGARFSGPTVHFVDEEYDTGPILAQAVVPVLPTDSAEALAGRVLKEEHRLYPKCVAAVVEGRVTFRHDGIPIIWSAH